MPGITLPNQLSNELERKGSLAKSTKSEYFDSYLDKGILKQLQRELNEEIVDRELNHKVQYIILLF